MATPKRKLRLANGAGLNSITIATAKYFYKQLSFKYVELIVKLECVEIVENI